jgi:hypothetical protein
LVIAAMAPGPAYHATWNGQHSQSRELSPGVLEITLPGGDGELRVE